MGCTSSTPKLPGSRAGNQMNKPQNDNNNNNKNNDPLLTSSSSREYASRMNDNDMNNSNSNSIRSTGNGSGMQMNENESKPRMVRDANQQPIEIQTIKQYTLGRELGHGQQARVRFATDREFNKYAIKVVKKKAALRRQRGAAKEGKFGTASGQVAKEIAVMKKLKHPNLVSLIEVLDDPNEDRLFLVLEFVDGGSLMKDEMTGQDSIEESLARHYFRQILSGIEYLHYHGIVHRDIKPSNILINKNGVVKISDFGVSTICEPLKTALPKVPGVNNPGALLQPERLASNSSSAGFAKVATPGLAPSTPLITVRGIGKVEENEQEIAETGAATTTSSSIPVAAPAIARTTSRSPEGKESPSKRGIGGEIEIEEVEEFDDEEPEGFPPEHSKRNSLQLSSRGVSARNLSVPMNGLSLNTSVPGYNPATHAVPETPFAIGGSYPVDTVQHDDKLDTQIGTLAFLPPEAIGSNQYSGKVADLWAAGITLYMMLYGEVPFQGETEEELFNKIKTEKLQFPLYPDRKPISSEAISLLKHMLAKKPSNVCYFHLYIFLIFNHMLIG